MRDRALYGRGMRIQPGTECDDGNLCTTDICNEVLGCLYLTNPAEICDDGVGCTLDSCVPEEGCQHDPIAAICDDGSPCTAFLCDPVDGCSFELQVGCCGNGLVEGGEFCDDGNGAPGDGCSPLCKGEIGSGYPSCAHILCISLGAIGNLHHRCGWAGRRDLASESPLQYGSGRRGMDPDCQHCGRRAGYLDMEQSGVMVERQCCGCGHESLHRLCVEHPAKLPMEDLLFLDLTTGAWLTYREIGAGIDGVGEQLVGSAEQGCLEGKTLAGCRHMEGSVEKTSVHGYSGSGVKRGAPMEGISPGVVRPGIFEGMHRSR